MARNVKEKCREWQLYIVYNVYNEGPPNTYAMYIHISLVPNNRYIPLNDIVVLDDSYYV